MFERFTDEARRALTVAQEEAKRLDHDFIGTEHLLLGLLAAAGDGAAGGALADLGVTLDDARGKVQDLVHPGRTAAPGNPPFTPLAKKALERSLRNALMLNDSFIGPEHMLLGLIDVPDGGGAQVLAELAGSLDHSREVVLAHIDKPAATTPRREGGSLRSRLWITRGGAAGTTSGESAGGAGTAARQVDGPLCPNCKASLAEHGRHRILAVSAAEDRPAPDDPDPAAAADAAADADDPADEAVTVTVVYCGNCGITVGLT